MKKVYTYLLIGCLFTTLDLSIGGLHLLPDSIGYLLIVIGAYLGESTNAFKKWSKLNT